MRGSVTVVHLVTGNHMHGYGRLVDGREFAVRASDGTVRLEIYRLDARQPVPDNTDVELVTERTSRDVDLDDERSARALVEDMALAAAPAAPSVREVVRALVTGISPADDPGDPIRRR